MFYDTQPEVITFVKSLSPPRPKSLWHYTSSLALIKILETQSLWFSDFRFVNDSSEISYGIELFKKSIHQRLTTSSDVRTMRLLQSLLDEFTKGLTWLSAYLVCFCEAEDSLNHWRYYAAKNSEPIAIEFDFQKFETRDWEPYRAKIVPIIYDPKKQEQVVTFAIDEFLKHPTCVDYLTSKTKKLNEIDFSLFVLVCCDICIQFKNPSFSSEAEWRIYTRFGLEPGAEPNLKYRSTGQGIWPYLSMKPANGGLPITGLMLGPGMNSDLQQAVHEALLIKFEYYQAKVQKSALPLRS